MTALHGANLALRFVLELAAFGALGYWGAAVAEPVALRILLATAAPLAAIVVWGLFVAPRATYDVGPAARLVLELAVFGAAVASLVSVDRVAWATALAIGYVANRVLLKVSEPAP